MSEIPSLPRTVVDPDPDAIVELGKLRRREIQVLSDRLGRVEDRGHGHLWSGAAVTLLSVGLGAVLASIPLLSSTEEWDGWVKPVYGGAVGMTLLLAAVCALAGRSVKRERADSVSDIKSDLDHLLKAYAQRPVPPPPSAQPLTEPAAAEAPAVEGDVLYLQRMRGEAQENLRLISETLAKGEFWKISDPTPTLKAWKKYSSYLERDPALAEVYAVGSRAANEVDSVMQKRSIRWLRGKKTVRPDDRLREAIDFLERFEGLLRLAIEARTGPPSE